jgi:soluble lytic murein transglycosylase
MHRSIVLGLAFLLMAAALVGWIHYRSAAYDHWIAQSAAENGIDFYLVKSLIYEESWFRPGIRGAAGELGLMQVSMGAARDFSEKKKLPPFRETQVLEPRQNIVIGSWYLGRSLERYKDSPAPAVFALLRYNAGETRANGWLQAAGQKPVPPGIQAEEFYLSFVDLPRTRNYVRRILHRARSRNFWF